MNNLATFSNSKTTRHVPEQLSESINFRLSEQTYKALQDRAAQEGLRPSQFLRSCVHKLLAKPTSARTGE